MDNSSLDDNLIISFQQNFESCSLFYEKVEMKDSNWRIHSFFVNISNQSILESKWRAMSNYIALHFQNKLESEFERWNLYVFYVLPIDINVELKYKIVNDTFSSRKIVVEGDYNYSDIIVKYILNDDIIIITKPEDKPENSEFVYNLILWPILNTQTANIRHSVTDKLLFEKIVEGITNSSYEI